VLYGPSLVPGARVWPHIGPVMDERQAPYDIGGASRLEHIPSTFTCIPATRTEHRRVLTPPGRPALTVLDRLKARGPAPILSSPQAER